VFSVVGGIVVVESYFFVADAVVLSLIGAAVAHDSRVTFLQQQQQQQQFFLWIATTILVFYQNKYFFLKMHNKLMLIFPAQCLELIFARFGQKQMDFCKVSKWLLFSRIFSSIKNGFLRLFWPKTRIGFDMQKNDFFATN
jgi:hypothetical protein